MWIALAATLLTLAPQDEIFSGPQKGEKTSGFKVFDLDTRKEVDYVTEWRGAPAVLVFVHELTRPGAALMRPLDRYAQIKSVRGLKIAFVSLVDDRDQAERHLPVVKGRLITFCLYLGLIDEASIGFVAGYTDGLLDVAIV